MDTSAEQTAGDSLTAGGAFRVFVRGIDERGAVGSFAERQPTAEELMALPLEARVAAIWDSGVHPTTPAMADAFLSCAELPGRGVFIAMAVQIGRTPNPRFYQGEGRNDSLVWGEAGCPVPLPKRTPPRRPSKRALERAMQEFDRKHGLFTLLRCGCLEECPGLAWHAQIEAAEDARKRELIEEHAAWDAARENALNEARRELVDELARETLRQPVNLDPETAGDFACILATEGQQ